MDKRKDPATALCVGCRIFFGLSAGSVRQVMYASSYHYLGGLLTCLGNVDALVYLDSRNA